MSNKFLFDDLERFVYALPEEGRLICIDFGTKKCGIALSDESRIISYPHTTVKRSGARNDLINISKLIIQHQACGLVMGLPLELLGTENPLCNQARRFAAQICDLNQLPGYLQDERFSTAEANYYCKTMGFSRKKSEKIDDKIAASVILRQTLETIRNSIIF